MAATGAFAFTASLATTLTIDLRVGFEFALTMTGAFARSTDFHLTDPAAFAAAFAFALFVCILQGAGTVTSTLASALALD